MVDTEEEKQRLNLDLDMLCGLGLLKYDQGSELYTMSRTLRAIAGDMLDDKELVRSRHANYYLHIAEDCAAFSEGGGEDGLYLASVLFDDHRSHIKQAFEWLQQQDKAMGTLDSFIVERLVVWETFGWLRFFPRSELI